MKKIWLLRPLLICGTLPLTGCGGGDGDSADDDNVATVATADDAAADVAETEDAAEPATEATVDFASIKPTGLRVIDRFTIAGRGTQFTVGGNSVPGATAYIFSTSFGITATETTPQTSFLRSGSGLFMLDAYALNAAGTPTRHALLYVE